ncbi:MAG: FG-GAP-like repeat-containing protein, partial [Verrucomicrobiota bacterium]
DGDGDVDALIGGSGSYRITPWFNDGIGATFTEGAPVSEFVDSMSLALGDLDGDGDLDAFTVLAASNRFKILLNDGAGGFTDVDLPASLQPPGAVALGDLDLDGDLDAFVTSEDGNRVWSNDGTADFSAGPSFGGAADRFDVRLGDLDGDGDLDAFVAASGPNRIWLNDGEGRFADSGQPLGSAAGSSLDLGDLDDDGDLDAIEVSTQAVAGVVWLNDGAAGFSASGPLPEVASNSGVRLGDLDGDGDLDAVAINISGPESIYLNDGSGAFTLGVPMPDGMSAGDAGRLALADFDGDGDLDALSRGIVWRNEPCAPITHLDLSLTVDGPEISAARQNHQVTVTVSNSGPSTAYGVTVTNGFAGLNLLGWSPSSCIRSVLDVVCSGHTLEAGETLTITLSVRTPSVPRVLTNHFVVGLVNGESDSSNNQTSWVIHVLAQTYRVTEVQPAHDQVHVAIDAAVRVTFNEPVDPLLIDGGFFVEGAQKGLYTGSWTLPAPDQLLFTPDVPFFPGEKIRIHLAPSLRSVYDQGLEQHISSFRTATRFCPSVDFLDVGQALGTAPTRDVAVGDLDGDGDLDVFAANWNNRDRTWFNRGSLGFDHSRQRFGNSASVAVAMGDVDGDLDLDILVANYNEANELWLNDGTGEMVDSGLGFGSVPRTDAKFGDFNGDGDLDLFVTRRAPMGDALWNNDGNGGFSLRSTLGTFDSMAVALGDVDGDGKLDAFVVQHGGPDQVWFYEISGSLDNSGQNLG